MRNKAYSILLFAAILSILVPGITLAQNSYNAQAAVDYADMWWDGRNPNYYDYGENDCANFVSQCLIAGGLDLSGYGTDSRGCLTTCTNLHSYLTDYPGVTWETRPKGQVEPLWFMPGDPAIFGYSDAHPRTHAVFVVTGDATHYTTCNAHSTDQYHKTIQWFYDNSDFDRCTFYHIPTFGRTIYVPDDYTTIQEAVDAVSSGDTVVVRSGTYVLGTLTVSEEVTLKLEPGVVMKFVTCARLLVKGYLVANGTADAHIVFTSINDDFYGGDTNGDGNATVPTKNDWGNICFIGSGGGSILDHVIVEYGGRGWSFPLYELLPAVGVYTSNLIISNSIISESGNEGISIWSASPRITDNIITNNNTGIYLYNASPTITGNSIKGNSYCGIQALNSSNPTVEENVIGDNGSWAIFLDPSSSGSAIFQNDLFGIGSGIYIRAGELNTSVTWNSNSTYVVGYYYDQYTMHLNIKEGAALTIEAGVVVKFEGGACLYVNGTLIADGEPENQIVFTSLKDDSHGGDTNGDESSTVPGKNDWGGILFGNTSTSSILQHVVVKYSGKTWSFPLYVMMAAIQVGTSDLVISNSTISDNGNEGISIWSRSPIITDNVITNNETGIYIYNASPTIAGNTVKDNRYGIYLKGSFGSEVYLNNFVDNFPHARSEDSVSFWHSERKRYTYAGREYTNYLGNYWDDYTGTDVDGDGIGDTPYTIGSDADNYPLMMPFENYSLLNPPTSPTQIIVLDWENDAPVRIVSVEIFGKTFSLVLSGTMPAATGLYSEYRAEVLQRVQQIFVDSGVDNVVITDSPVDATTVVYFTDWVGGDLLGRSYVGSSHNLGYDRFNRSSDDGAVVFTFGNAEVDAETVAHEVGHTFGLRHVDPDIAADPYNASVMDLDYVPDVNPRFINELSDITDPLSPYNHNPVYHLKRYVDGVPHNDLVAQGIYQGTWDMQPLELIRIILDFGSSDRVLYDVSLLVGAKNDSMMTIAYFDETTLLKLSALEFTVEKGDLLQLVASCTLGGDLDTLLGIGDPNEEANLLVQPIVGQFKVYLQTESDSGSGYVTIAEPNVSGTIFDPNSDFDRDGNVDLSDLDRITFHWLAQDCSHANLWCEGTDLDYSGRVNFVDFAIFVENWLWEKMSTDIDID